MAPKISVIVPMYNAEKYIGLAIESVLAQEFRDFELILIDDCSTDRTLEIAKSFNDRRIEIVELEKNLGGDNGPGLVRNIGLERARGEYIYFIDNDDVILPNGLQVLFDAAVKNSADIVIAIKNFVIADKDFINLDKMSNLQIQYRGKMNVISDDLKTRIWDEYARKFSPAAPWLHLYRRDFLEAKGLTFKKAVIHDDGIWLLELLCATTKIAKIDEPFYIWCSREESLSHSTAGNFNGFTKRVESFLIMLDSFEEILSEALKREYGEVDHYFIDTLCLQIKNRGIVGPMKHAYNASPIECWQIIRRELETRYGSDMPLLRKMMHGYFVEALSNKTDADENIRLKAIMKHLKNEVNRLIPF